MNRDRKARRDALKRRQEAEGADTRQLTRRGLILLGAQLAVGAVLASRMRGRQIVEAGKLMGVPVHDHIIIAENGYTSLAERELLGS